MSGSNVTGAQLRDAMIAADIKRVDHHRCGICGAMTAYVRHGTALYFDSSCDCGPPMGPPEPSDWDQAATWVNLQVSEEARGEQLSRFGFKESAATCQHTPGPWRVFEGQGTHVVAGTDPVVFVANVGARSTGDNRSIEVETESNARLIASAPEMLEALQRVVALCDDIQDRFQLDCEPYVGLARAAVAKATEGGAS